MLCGIPGVAGGSPVAVDPQTAEREFDRMSFAGEDSLLPSQVADQRSFSHQLVRDRGRRSGESLQAFNVVQILDGNGNALEWSEIATLCEDLVSPHGRGAGTVR